MKIAFFDSGIGGLSVLAEALGRFGEAEFLYFADEDHVPYGTKSKAEIVRLSLDAVGFLVARGAEAVVVACNTATSAAITELRSAFSVPVIGMEPAVKLAADRFGARPTLLIATPLTIAGEKLAHLVERLECETWSLPLPRLVEFAQDLEFDSPAVRAYLQGELGKFELARLSSLVLGCTHFNYFKDVLREILPPHVRIIDGIEGTLNRLASELAARGKNLRKAEEFDVFGKDGLDVNFTQKCGENSASLEQVDEIGALGLTNSGFDDANAALDLSQKSGAKFKENIVSNFDRDGAVKFELDTSGGKFEHSSFGSFGSKGALMQDGLQKIDVSDPNSAFLLNGRILRSPGGWAERRNSKIRYPNGNSVEYFRSGRALNAAQLRKVEIFLKRLEKMRDID